MQHGGQALDVHSELTPMRLAQKAVQLQWRVVLLPWSLFLMCTSASAAVLVRFLVFAGVPPSEYADKAKVRELTSVVEHMHQREDAYRRKLKELQEEGEARLKDKKKAVTKLQKARAELAELHGQLGEDAPLESPLAQAGVLSSGRPRHLVDRPQGLSRAGMHLSMVLASSAALWLFRQDHVPVISRKIISSVAFPTWFFWGWLLFLRAPSPFTNGLYCAAWFLLGFVACQWVANYSL